MKYLQLKAHLETVFQLFLNLNVSRHASSWMGIAATYNFFVTNYQQQTFIQE